MSSFTIPLRQTVALVRELGGPVEFVDDYPIQKPGLDEVLAKVLYTGVCQSGTYCIRVKTILYSMSNLTTSQIYIPVLEQLQARTGSL